MDKLIEYKALSKGMAMFLQSCVRSALNIVISGGTGSGKTTMLNALSSYIPHGERILTIEDAAELVLQQEHVVRLEAKPANIEGRGEVSIRDLVKSSLRMRPDRVVIGECRGGEALDMIQAMNTGHDGSLTTVHANTPRDALSRVATLVLMAGVDLPERAIREQISSAIHLFVQISRLQDGSRRCIYVTEVQGMEGNMITLQDIFLFEQLGLNEDGKVRGVLKGMGIIPKHMTRLKAHGENLPPEVFSTKIEVP
jgi:pilus assembly protein CpaF